MVWNFIPALVATVIGKGMRSTEQYNQARSAEGAYDAQEESLSGYVNQLKQDLAPFLQGKALPSERAATEGAKSAQADEAFEARQRLQQAYARAGITGGEGEGSVAAKGITGLESDLADRLAGLEAQLQEFTGERQQRAIETVAQAQAGKAQALAPFEANSEQLKAGLTQQQGDFATPLLQTFLPSLIAGASNMFQGQSFGGKIGEGATAPYQTKDAEGNIIDVPVGGYQAGQDPSALATQTGIQNLLAQMGIDPKMFAQADAPKPGQPIPEYETDVFGNKRAKSYKEAPLTSREKLEYGKSIKEDTQVKTNYQNTLATINTSNNRKEIQNSAQNLVDYLSAQGSLTSARLKAIESSIEKRGQKVTLNLPNGNSATYNPSTKDWE